MATTMTTIYPLMPLSLSRKYRYAYYIYKTRLHRIHTHRGVDNDSSTHFTVLSTFFFGFLFWLRAYHTRTFVITHLLDRPKINTLTDRSATIQPSDRYSNFFSGTSHRVSLDQGRRRHIRSQDAYFEIRLLLSWRFSFSGVDGEVRGGIIAGTANSVRIEQLNTNS